MCAKLLCQPHVLPQPLLILFIHSGSCRRLHKKGSKTPTKRPCHPCSSTDNLRVGRGRRKTHQNMLISMVIAPALDSGIFRQQIDPVRTAPQSNFTQSSQIFYGKKTDCCTFRMIFPINLSACHALQQFRRFNIHQLHLIRLIKNRIRYTLLYQTSGNRSNGIVQAFNMLNIDCRVNIDSGIQQFLYILITLGMPTALRIGMSQFVHQNQLWLLFQRTINIKLPKGPPPVKHLFRRKLLQTAQQCCYLRSEMGFYVSCNHINTTFFCLMRRL